MQQENDRLRTCLESSRLRNPQGVAQNEPLARANKGKEPLLPDHSDHHANDKLSSDSSPLPRLSPPPSNAEAESRKRPPRQSSRAMSGTRRRVQREGSGDGPRSQLAPEHVVAQFGGTAPPFLHARYPPGALPVPHAALYPPVQGPYDMLSSPLGQHILDYKPPRGFVIPSFAMYDSSSDSYDHMLHFNQAMILNAEDDRLLCKVFPASLKGPALAWFHKLPRGSINSFDELWAVFVSQYLCSVRQKGNISSLQAILKREDKSIRDFTRRFGQAVQQTYIYSMDAVLKNFRRSFGPTTSFFQSLSLDPPATMEELYRRADKFSTLEDNIWAASQTVMITTQSGKPAPKGSSEQKGSQNKGQKRSDVQSEKRKEPPQFTPLNITYDRLLPLIYGPPRFQVAPSYKGGPGPT